MLKAETTRAGMVLANGSGLTLYYFSVDKPDSGKSVCTGGCAVAWPPLAAPVKAPAGVRLPGPLGMITRPGGVRQVTLNGFPVYTYVGDRAPGQVTGDGKEGAWHVIKLGAVPAGDGPEGRAHPGRDGAGQQPRPDAVHLQQGQAAQRQVGLYRSLRHRLAAAGRAGQGPGRRAPARRLGVITRPDGVKQVTLNGYPLYRYAGDKSSGQATGNGIGGSWHVITIKA